MHSLPLSLAVDVTSCFKLLPLDFSTMMGCSMEGQLKQNSFSSKLIRQGILLPQEIKLRQLKGKFSHF